MDRERTIRIQAYADGALPAQECREVEQWLAQDAEARALLESFRQLKSLVAANEPAPKLPESREFYWSRLEREIAKSAATATREGRERKVDRGWVAWWAPFAAVTVVALGITWLFQLAAFRGSQTSEEQSLASAVDEDNTITFYSPEAKMTVVWVDLREN